MKKQVLITGGAGFIGSHLADELLERGYGVRVFDNLTPQVHGGRARRPDYLNPEVELVPGDVRDPEAVRRALKGVDAVFHFAAAVGVGQSMYEIALYTDINNLGTAVLLQQLIERKVECLIVASSMSVYGEGLYLNAEGDPALGTERSLEQLMAREWELRGAGGRELRPVPTPETKQPSPASIYALSKYDQERMCLIIGRAYNIPTIALRFFNVYGLRQALSNPYTGVLAIFASRFLNDKPPMIFEDGLQRRDFVHVRDAARACRLALETPATAIAEENVFNIGGGKDYAIREIAERMAVALGKERVEPEITGRYRAGDIRHCYADITLARRVLGYEPRVTLEEGLIELASWLETQSAVDRVTQANAELAERGLTA
ncbi:MAG: NAD-dependent epimerase/dehydratase family protein [Blastocatellales bacterium]